MSPRIRIGLTALLIAVLAAGLSTIACGGDDNGGGTSTPVAATATTAPQATSSPAVTSTPESNEVSASIADFAFTPAEITIAVGDTVTWTNNGPSVHTVTADDGSFDSGNLSQGQTFSHTFQSAGTFTYHCTPHPFMTASVVVQSGSTAASPGY